MVKPFFRPMLRLQWKLTFSYTLITATTLVLLTLVGMITGSEVASANFSHLATGALQAHASELALYLSAAPPDRAGVERWLQQPGNRTVQVVLSTVPRTTYEVTLNGLIVVVDQKGIVVASDGSGNASPGTLLEQVLPRQAKPVLQAALGGQTDEHHLVTSLANDLAIAAYPLLGPYGQIEGALVAQTTGLSQPSLLLQSLFGALILGIPVALLAALIGTFFGFFTARGFSQRFKNLSFTVEQWGEGHFTMLAKDASGDELGYLARRLNRMAEQFQALLHSRQKLAMLEERHRLARDLHDSAKQQMFAISMLVNSAKGLLRSDPDRAHTCLEETDAFVQHVQQELTALVQALRPTPLKEKGLVAAVRELAEQWSHQSGIPTQIKVQGELSPSAMIEETLFRIVQEALANVARHSRATTATITLTSELDAFTLRIDDNGQGFDRAAIQGKGVGLLSMQERVHTLGGTFLLESAPGKGTDITVRCTEHIPGEGKKEDA